MIPLAWAAGAWSWIAARGVLLGLLAAALAASWVGGCQYKAKQFPAALARERAALVESERDCRLGSVCAGALAQRAADQAAAVEAAVARANSEHAAALAALQADQAAAVEAMQAARVEDRRRLAAIERRYRAALVDSEDCRIWSAKPVPCPLD